MKQSLAILLATYNPRIDWLTELLQSLNRQTYPNLCLYVRDDASTSLSFSALRALIATHVTRFPFTVLQNEANVGSTQTFAALIEDCHEHYIAFCDQDDVWDDQKLAASVELFEKSPLCPTLVCTNLRVINDAGKVIAPTMEAHRRRHTFARGRGLAKSLIYRNFVTGCTVVMERTRAVSYLPFPDAVLHDHYLAFRAALDGAIDYLPKPQISYRIWGGNQSGVMTRVQSKQDYKTHRIDAFAARLQAFRALSDLPALAEAEEWGRARIDYFNRVRGSTKRLYRRRQVNPTTTRFELIALHLPAPLFRLAVWLIRRGVL